MNALKIYLAEDDGDDIMFFKEALEQCSNSCSLTVCENGKDLLSDLSGSRNTLPTIIFLDINMPVMDGFSALQKIKSEPELKDIHVIMLTTSASAFTIDKAFELGASLFVKKPYSMQDLQNMIERVLQINWNEKTPPVTKSDFIYK